VYLDAEARDRLEDLPRRFSNVSRIVRVVLSAVVMNDEEFSKWLKGDRQCKETYLWIREKVGGQRKLDL